MTNPKLSPLTQAVLEHSNCEGSRIVQLHIADAFKALGILAYGAGEGSSHRNVVDFDDILAIAKELENQGPYQPRGVEWEDDDGPTPGWKQLARQGR